MHPKDHRQPRPIAIVVYGHNPTSLGDASQYTDWYNGTYYASAGIIGTDGTYQQISRHDNDDCDLRGTKPERNTALKCAKAKATEYAKFLGLEVQRWEFCKQVKPSFRYPESRGDALTNRRWKDRR